MKHPLSVWIAIPLLWAGCLFAQDSSWRAQTTEEAHQPSAGAADILSDTKGVDFAPYVGKLRQTVRDNWLRIAPDIARPPFSKEGKVSIRFQILKNGKVGRMKLDRGSGDVMLDRAAWGSIMYSSPFEPLPSDFDGQSFELRLNFYYNPKPAQLQVGVGSSHQFLETPESAPLRSVSWSVGGPGCSGSACGEISASGLYTAPLKIPDPPTVTVVATLLADTRKTVSRTLTIVQVDPPH